MERSDCCAKVKQTGPRRLTGDQFFDVELMTVADAWSGGYRVDRKPIQPIFCPVCGVRL